MANLKTKHTRRVIRRSCSICDKKFAIVVNPDRSYSGGHYFGKIPTEKGKVEYWECDECGQEDDSIIREDK